MRVSVNPWRKHQAMVMEASAIERSDEFRRRLAAGNPPARRAGPQLNQRRSIWAIRWRGAIRHPHGLIEHSRDW